ncbi:MAG: type II toxin-antitoxin system RelE/ParE family toxin [Spirochaetia bacterium]|nr:type II toxin-antitoxin system RelE/ParE family toxin [Spirochaetia bacterium]
MGREVIWSPRSRADLQSIFDFIAKDSVRYAQHTIDRIFKIADGIPDFPLLGRIVPEFEVPTIRERIMGNYRIVYRVKDTEIQILTVHHSARLMGDL